MNTRRMFYLSVSLILFWFSTIQSQDTCSVNWQGIPFLTVSESITAGQFISVKQDPLESNCTSIYNVTDLTWAVVNNNNETLHLEVQPAILSVDSTMGGIPGNVIYLGSTQIFDLAAFTSNGLTITLDDTVAVNGQYFAGLLFTATPNADVDIAIDDGNDLRSGWSYLGSGGSWQDLVLDKGYAGNPVLGSQGNNGTTTDTVTENRFTMWALGDSSGYIDIDFNFFDIIQFNAALSSTGQKLRWHYGGDLNLTYDACKLFPTSTTPLLFEFFPKNTPGLEFEAHSGFGAEVAIVGLHSGFLVEVDREEDFTPPTPDGVDTRTTPPGYAEVIGLEATCVAGIGTGITEFYDLKASQVHVQLTIVDPPGGNAVYWKETGTDVVSISFSAGHPQSSTVSLVVPLLPGYVGPVKIQSTTTNSKWYLLADTMDVGVGGGAHYHPVPCLAAVSGTIAGRFPWPSGFGTFVLLEFQDDESDRLEWELEVGAVPCQAKIIRELQDLTGYSFRASNTDYPIIGGPDTIRTVIHNVYDSVCSPYNSITLSYFLDEGFGPVPIGSNVLTGADASLNNFNSGLVDSIVNEFVFDSLNPAYIFTRTHKWLANDPNPRYMVALSPTPSAPCPGWIVMSNASRGTANDTMKVSFIRPIPDFAIDSLFVKADLNLEVFDTVDIDYRVTNRGNTWPPTTPLNLPPDSIFVNVRVSFEIKTALNQWVEAFGSVFSTNLITPMAAGASANFNALYAVDPDTVTFYGPFDRVRFIIEVNDGNTPLTARVFEGNYENNIAEYLVPFTKLPTCIIPSDSLHFDGDVIDSTYPTYNVNGPCPQPIYLYVADTSLSFSPPNTLPSILTVDLGAGPQLTPPEHLSWNWNSATFVKDFTNANGDQYKVYVADLCQLPIGFGPFSYCFRASLDWADFDPHYSYADNNGVCFAAGNSGANLFDGKNAGVVVGNPFSCCIGSVGNIDNDDGDIVDIADLTFLIDHLFINFPILACPAEGNVDGDLAGLVDIADLTFLIDHLFINFPVLQPCPD